MSGYPKQGLVDHFDEQTVLQLKKVLRDLRNMFLEIKPRGDLVNIQRQRPVSLENIDVHAKHLGNWIDRLTRSFDAFKLNKHRDIKVLYWFSCPPNLVGRRQLKDGVAFVRNERAEFAQSHLWSTLKLVKIFTALLVTKFSGSSVNSLLLILSLGFLWENRDAFAR